MPEGPTATAPACPVCGKPRATEHKPFCSARCADRDLHRWLTGGYAVPAASATDEEEDDGPPRRARDPDPDGD
ncbi:MAG: DNA gyrase inhibitor YacG [Hyphomicrobiales bacterium]|nr:DNA gyrase inhibitor YacG [Hyphomicrobiales bacterium]MDE2016443.1 DNA gyrase inhibitor YacG [Hyphomicrobiales bacterium]